MKFGKYAKKISAMLLAGVMLIASTACNMAITEPSEPEKSGDRRQEEFRAVIQNVINRYGVRTEYDRWDEMYKPGLWAAKAVDVTRDGEDELCLIYVDGENVRMEMYEYKDGRAERVWSDKAGFTGIFEFVIRESEEAVFWHYQEMRNLDIRVAAYMNGEYVNSGSGAGFTEEDYDYVYSKNDGLAGEDGRIFDLTLKKMGITYGGGYVEGLIYDFNSEELDVDELIDEWGVVIPEPRVSPLEALENIAYYGDKSICKMPKEMACAYAEAIESEEKLAKAADGEYEIKAVLMDIANDGMPLLVTAVVDDRTLIGRIVTYDNNTEGVGIWTWNGEKAEKYNFRADAHKTQLSYFFAKDGTTEATIYINDGWKMFDGDSSGVVSYKVSNATISMLEHSISYRAYREDSSSDIMVGTSLPGVNAKEHESGYSATIDELIKAGWIGENENPQDNTYLYLRTKNGEPVKYSSYEEYRNDNEIYGFYGRDSYHIIQQSGTATTTIKEEWTVSEDAKDALELYADVAGKPNYSYNEVSLLLTEEQRSAIEKAVASRYEGELGEIYKIADDLYYIIVYLNDEFSGGVILKNTENGNAWKFIKQSNELLTESELAAEAGKDEDVSNISIDYSKTKNGVEYLTEVLGNIDGTVPNRTAKESLAAYVENYLSENTQKTIKAKGNKITLAGSAAEKMAEAAEELYSELTDVLEGNNAMPNKEISTRLKFICKKVDLSKGIQLEFNEDSVISNDEADALVFVLDDKGTSVTVGVAQLETLIDEYGAVIVIIKLVDENVYDVQFTDEYGELIEQLNGAVSIAVPAANELCTIQAEYVGGTDNWGGHYSAASSTLTFDTSYSGRYSVLDKNMDITDISGLSEEHQEAIRFMVSKEYFSLEEGKFNPESDLTRYAFSEALVRIFFSLDRSLKTSFTDVSEDSRYYPYVASGEVKGIIEGYEDSTFRGERAVRVEEAVSLASRALMERKGYTEPENAFDYLHFTDNDDISEWAERAIALAVREGLIDDGNMLYPQSVISRADSALILYRLFMLLYQIEPVSAEAAPGGFPIIPVAVAVIILLGVGVAVCLLIRKKKKENN